MYVHTAGRMHASEGSRDLLEPPLHVKLQGRFVTRRMEICNCTNHLPVAVYCVANSIRGTGAGLNWLLGMCL